MKKTVLYLIAGFLIFTTACNLSNQQTKIQTICNPVNLSYRFRPEVPSRREAADPSIVLYRGEYYMFASKSDGYFHSADLVVWDLVTSADLPFEPYAPAAEVIGDEIYFITDHHKKIYKTNDPKSGKWEIANDHFSLNPIDGENFNAYLRDIALFADDDGRLYFYGGGGGGNILPVAGIEIDRQTLEPVGKPASLIFDHKEKYGWEICGDFNEFPDEKTYIEGAFMIKHNGKYYLHYAAPGTQFKSYCDAVYVSDKPLDGFILQEHNPIAYKPGGFIAGAGHGSAFKDKHGNYWHSGTSIISVRHIFERRINLFPTFFDNDGEMYVYTAFGDYPMIIPDKKLNSPEDFFPEWMLLSYNKPVTVSSTMKKNTELEEKITKWWADIEDFSAKNAVDEEVRTWWSAETGKQNEWFSVDLENICEVYALQINFADQDSELFGRSDSIYYQYIIEESSDGKNWKTLVDKSKNTIDAVHEYIQLEKPVKTKYLKIKNIRVPSGKFSLYDFRVFGKSNKTAPAEVSEFVAIRGTDRRNVHISWNKIPGADGYNIRFGSAEGKLYQNYMVYGKNELDINALNIERDYFFAIDAFNEGGITQGKTVWKEK